MSTASVSATEFDKGHHSHTTRYLVTWVALLCATFATWGQSFVNLGDWSVVIVLLIAVFKSSLVALFFMHLWDHRGATRLVFVVTMVFVLSLMIISIADVHTRVAFGMPNQAPAFDQSGTNIQTLNSEPILEPNAGPPVYGTKPLAPPTENIPTTP